MRRPWLAVVLLVPAAPAPAAEPRDPLEAAVAAALDDPALRKAEVAVAIRDCATGERLVGIRADVPMIPASNAKVPTCAAAWLRLGPDWEWETPLLRQGDVDAAGRLQGDLLVRGAGDPTISARFGGGRAASTLEAWARAVHAAGIRAVAGALLVDDAAFDAQRVHPSWPAGQASQWYSAQVSALTLNDACVDVTLAPGESRPRVACDPDTAYVSFDNEASATANRKEHSHGCWRAPGTNAIRVTGKYWRGAGPVTQSVPVDDPATFFGAVLRECLRREGIEVAGGLRRATPAEAARPGTALARHRSPLHLAVGVCLQRSQNLYAEQILKTLGHAATGRGTFADGSAAVADTLRAAGVPEGAIRLADGSGFSRDSRVTADALARILTHMARRPDGDRFRACLAAPGEAGTLDDRLTDPVTRDRVRAKTGYLQGISALCGYADTRDGGRVAFAVLVNGLEGPARPAKAAQDAIARACVEHGPNG